MLPEGTKSTCFEKEKPLKSFDFNGFPSCTRLDSNQRPSESELYAPLFESSPLLLKSVYTQRFLRIILFDFVAVFSVFSKTVEQ